VLRLAVGLVLVLCVSGCVSIDEDRAAIDEAMWSRVSAEYGAQIDSAVVAGYLDDVGERLLPQAPASAQGPTSWTYHVFDDDRVQAFSTIDGHVALTRGLVDRLDAEDELAAILARQIAHARLQHEWQFMINQIDAAGFFIYPKGAVTTGGTRAAKVEYASWLFHRKGVGFMHPFQTWQLVEADRAALVMLEGAGYDPRGIERALEISSQGGTQYAYTYGHVGERTHEIDAWLQGHQAAPPGDADVAAFDAFKAAIAPGPP
jgi:predicted Zn-dependent protease